MENSKGEAVLEVDLLFLGEEEMLKENRITI